MNIKLSLVIVLLLLSFPFYAQQTELLTNPNFDNGTNGWWIQGANVTSGNGEVVFNITNPGTNSWDIQLGQGGLTLRKGYKYTLSWRAKRESGLLDFRVQLDHAPYTFLFGKQISQDGSWKESTIVYEQTDSDIQGAAVNVQMGGSSARVTIDYIYLKEEPITNTFKKHFTKGVNITDWLHNVDNIGHVQFTKYTKQDFIDIKSLGCDVIRLTINMKGMTNGAPNYTFDPRFFYFLDQIIDMAEEVGINIIIDNHYNSATPSNVDQELIPIWRQVAQRYKNRSTYVFYEIMNEPHGISEADWNVIQKKVLAAIREIDNTHTVIVTCTNYSNYNNLSLMPLYDDNNLIYTFHFYEPFVFTHQGTSYVTPTLTPLSGVPFPYSAARMPSLPSASRGDWIETSYNNYSTEGTVEYVHSLIDKAAAFSSSRNVHVFCGEFGTNMDNVPPADRAYWHQIVSSYMKQKNISWTLFEYKQEFPPVGFGLFNLASVELFNHDINVPLANALGFTPPPQNKLIIQPENSGFTIYTDYISPRIYSLVSGSNWGLNATLDFCSEENPKDEKFCIYWGNADQYYSMRFDFKPNKDLSTLAAENYRLSLYIKGNTSGTSFDIRFIDSDTGPNDHAWPMKYTIDDSKIAWDGQWHKVIIPLKDFREVGVYEDKWYEPKGEFDWKAVDVFEISAQQKNITGKLWFDRIEIIAPLISVPDSPNLLSPASNITKSSVNATFMWRKIKSATKYYFQLSTNSQFTTIIKSDTTLTDTTTSISGLLEGNKYYWRLQAKNTAGSSAWSETRNFTTILSSPTNLKVERIALKELKLQWTDNSSNEDGYFIERKRSSDTNYSIIDSVKNGSGIYTDKTVDQGQTYNYRVVAYTKFAKSEYSNEATFVVTGVEKDVIPTEYSLNQNYPNPFNPTTIIKYQLPKEGFVSIKIYDVLGKEIVRLVNETKQAGYHEIKFDSGPLSGGVYFYRIEAGSFIDTKKFILMK